MPPLYRFVEAGIYSLLNFLPFLLLALYPFREHLRFSKPVTALMIFFASLVQLLLGFWAAFYSGESKAMISVVSTLIYAAFYFLTVKAYFGKTLFTLLFFSNIANFSAMSAKCLEGQLFGAQALESYRWSYSLCFFIVLALLLVPLSFYIRKVYTPAVNHRIRTNIWRYTWLIPATFYLIWYYIFYGDTEHTSLEIALNPMNILVLLFINLGAFFVHYIVICFVNETAENAELLQSNHQFAMQTLQYDNLSERIDETRKAKHDLRHHMTVLTGFIDSGHPEAAAAYLHTYLQTLPDYGSIVLCNHPVFNALLLYFSQLAKEADTRFETQVDLPCSISIADNDLAVLVGNLLENAVHACSIQKKGARRIALRARIDGGSLIITLDNTFDAALKHGADGALLSTKPGGLGLGIESARVIAMRYRGAFKIEQNDGLFMISIMMELE